MPVYNWYQTPVDSNGTATANSVLVTVWVDTSQPPAGSSYDIVIIEDAPGDGNVSSSEWKDYTGGGKGLNGGNSVKLFDGSPGGAGVLYSSQAYSLGDTGLTNDLVKNFAPVDADALDVCFLAGTQIATPNGLVLVEDLGVGDLVLTRDDGPQPIRWISRRDITPTRLDLCPDLRPIEFAPGSLGRGLPRRSLRVSPQHRALISDANSAPVLASARHLAQAGWPGVRVITEKAPFTLIHFAFDNHQLVLAEGAEMESFYPGPMALRALSPMARGKLIARFPELAHGTNPMQPVRPFLKRRELTALMAQLQSA